MMERAFHFGGNKRKDSFHSISFSSISGIYLNASFSFHVLQKEPDFDELVIK